MLLTQIAQALGNLRGHQACPPLWLINVRLPASNAAGSGGAHRAERASWCGASQGDSPADFWPDKRPVQGKELISHAEPSTGRTPPGIARQASCGRLYVYHKATDKRIIIKCWTYSRTIFILDATLRTQACKPLRVVEDVNRTVSRLDPATT